MTSAVTRALHVLSVTDKGVRCTLDPSALDAAFWLPRGHVNWAKPPEAGKCVVATLPGWLASKHRQLDDEAALEARRDHQQPLELVASQCVRHETRKEPDMADRPADAGTGALFRNTKAEKPTHPSHTGECEINGQKFWISAWVKEKGDQKYFSLAFRPKDGLASAKPKPAPVDDSEIPF